MQRENMDPCFSKAAARKRWLWSLVTVASLLAMACGKPADQPTVGAQPTITSAPVQPVSPTAVPPLPANTLDPAPTPVQDTITFNVDEDTDAPEGDPAYGTSPIAERKVVNLAP